MTGGNTKAYADFSLPELKQAFHLSITEDESLFSEVEPVEVPATLATLLQEHVPLALAIDTEADQQVWIDLDEYHIREAGKLFAILLAIQ